MSIEFMGDSADKCDRNFYRNIAGSAVYDRKKPGPDFLPPLTCLIDNPWLKPKTVLEIGAGNGCVLSSIYLKTNADCYGIDPSPAACEYGNKNFEGVKLYKGTAECYPDEVKSQKYELIIFGGVLFHIPPWNFFKCISNSLDILKENGYIMIFDFHNQGNPIYRKYKHEASQYIYKYDHTQILSAHPCFRLLYHKTIFAKEYYIKKTDFDTAHYASLWKVSSLEKFTLSNIDPSVINS